MNPRLDKNILVISDLHLGEDLRPTEASVSYLRRLVLLERELCAFLDHYAAQRVGERPWRLVINGDMVDFMNIQIMPCAEDGVSAAATDDERAFGLGHGEIQSLTKLDRVIARHPGVFRALAGFVAAGHELVLVVGNHDVEFHYEAVQARFVAALCARGAEAARIRFCPWFYYREEVVYVEHGHQYDEFCSFDYQLHPVERHGGVALSVAHAGVRYFTNRVPQMDPHCAEGWNFVDYVRWGWAQGARGMARVFLFYAGLIRKLIELWAALTDRASDAERAALHATRLRALAGSYRLAVDKVEALDGLRRLPVLKNLGKLLMTMFLDRFILGLLTAMCLGVVLASTSGWGTLGGCGAVMAVAAAVNYTLSRLRFLDSSILLRRAPEAIQRIIQAPFIIFGHSHKPETVRLRSGGTYFNTGTWLSDDGHRATFTHVIISGEEEPRAELYQWRDGASTPLP